MAVVEIPTRNDIDRYSVTVDIDGTSYRMLFAYNTRASAWVLSIFSIDGDELAMGIPVVIDSPLLARWSGVDALPRDGFLMAVDVSGELTDMAKEDLGDKVRLSWIPLEDVG